MEIGSESAMGWKNIPVERLSADEPVTLTHDCLAVEEPLEIRLGDRSLSITMRTPGHDRELVAGFLLSEGIINQGNEILKLEVCPSQSNVVRVDLAASPDWSRISRHFYTTSSCGVCGKSSLEALEATNSYSARIKTASLVVGAKDVKRLPALLREGQKVFGKTGGLHATGLFTPAGRAFCIREDVGRHNAFDKVVGHALLAKQVPLLEMVAVVSGRASFELLQKAAMAGIPFVAAVGAPSTLAVACAEKFGVTLVGFVREDRFNVYCGGWRINYDKITGNGTA